MPPSLDRTHASLRYHLSEIEHRYGPRVHILSNPYAMSLLARLGSPRTAQPVLNELVHRLYADLLGHVIDAEFPRKRAAVPTRMAAKHPVEGVYRGEVIDPKVRIVVVNVARAGTLPSQVCFETLNYLLDARHVRQDHVFMNRRTNKKGEVVGVDLSGSKIGGSLDGAIVLIPDPMGATGSSILQAMHHLEHLGRPERFIALHLIVTPEYLTALANVDLPFEVYAIRLDRGLSSAEALASVPGTHPGREKGLNAIHYILPGAGGLGEILNNAER